MRVICTDHFSKRVQQRLHGVSPKKLARGIVWAIEQGRIDLVRFAGRCKYENCVVRRFQFDTPDGRTFEAVVNDETHKMMKFVTVYPKDPQ